jgi:hypothetical protein
MFTEKEDDELYAAVQEGLITPPPSVIEDSAFASSVPFQRGNIDDVSNHKNGHRQHRAKWLPSWI